MELASIDAVSTFLAKVEYAKAVVKPNSLAIFVSNPNALVISAVTEPISATVLASKLVTLLVIAVAKPNSLTVATSNLNIVVAKLFVYPIVAISRRLNLPATIIIAVPKANIVGIPTAIF